MVKSCSAEHFQFEIFVAKQDDTVCSLLVFWHRPKENLGFQNNNILEDNEVTDVTAGITEETK